MKNVITKQIHPKEICQGRDITPINFWIMSWSEDFGGKSDFAGNVFESATLRVKPSCFSVRCRVDVNVNLRCPFRISDEERYHFSLKLRKTRFFEN